MAGGWVYPPTMSAGPDTPDAPFAVGAETQEIPVLDLGRYRAGVAGVRAALGASGVAPGA